MASKIDPAALELVDQPENRSPEDDPFADVQVFDDPPPLPRRQLDEEVVSVLRAEAEREATARLADAAQSGAAQAGTAQAGTAQAGTAQSGTAQSGADPTSGVSAPTAEMTALERLAAAIAVPASDAGASQPDGHDHRAAAKGAGRLPDIDMIRETLHSSEVDAADDADAEPDVRFRSGFRAGFLSVLVLGVLMSLAYVFAGEIVAYLPQSEPYLRSYVIQVDEARTWVDALIRSATNMLQGNSGDA